MEDSDSSLAGSGSAPPYGIDDAIRLMRSLPSDHDIDSVVGVVRVTLGSLNVNIKDIITDASWRQRSVQESIDKLQLRITDLEEQLAGRRRDMAAMQAELKETTAVKERLHLAAKDASEATAGPAGPTNPSGSTSTRAGRSG